MQDISLAEALCGTSFYVQHLDGRVLEVVTLPGEVIKPDSWKCINEEGMPVHGRPYEKGNLYIRFAVKFPESLSSEEVQQLKQVLPSPPQPQAPMSEDEPEQVNCSPPCLHKAQRDHTALLAAMRRALSQHPTSEHSLSAYMHVACRNVYCISGIGPSPG